MIQSDSQIIAILDFYFSGCSINNEAFGVYTFIFKNNFSNCKVCRSRTNIGRGAYFYQSFPNNKLQKESNL